MIHQPHTIKAAVGSKHTRKLRGRGNASGHGNYSGHGGKGQTARSGGSRGLKIKSIKFLLQSTPKLRGFHSLNEKVAEVYLNDLDKKFKDGDVVNLTSLKEKGLLGKNKKQAKILNTGEITKKLTIDGIKCTVKAQEKIVKVGGTVK